MANGLIYLDTHFLQKGMRIRSPKTVLTSFPGEKGKMNFEIYI